MNRSGSGWQGGPESPGPDVRIAAFTDLIFGARIRAAASPHGIAVLVTTSPDRVVEAARRGLGTVFIDLDVRGADPVALIGRLKADPDAEPAFIVAFASHVRTAAIEAARDAGADRVLARGAFARQLPQLVGGRARTP